MKTTLHEPSMMSVIVTSALDQSESSRRLHAVVENLGNLDGIQINIFKHSRGFSLRGTTATLLPVVAGLLPTLTD